MEKIIDKKNTYNRVEQALEQVRPYLQADGGDVRLVEITDNMVAKLELLGNCISCPISEITLQAGISDSIKRYVPEIKEIQASNESIIL